MARSQRRPRGTGLVETMMSLVLLLLCLLWVLNLLPTARRSSRLHLDHGRAALLARQVLQQALESPFAQLAGTAGQVTMTGTTDGHEWSRRFDYTVSVAPVNDHLKSVWARVTWTDAGTPREVVVETMLADRPRGAS